MKQPIVPVALGLTAVCGAIDVGWQVIPVQAAASKDVNYENSNQTGVSENTSNSTLANSPEALFLTTMPVAEEVQPMTSKSVNNPTGAIALSFEPPTTGRFSPVSPTQASPTAFRTPSSIADSSQKPMTISPKETTQTDLFAGGSESLVARTVGAAEGTRNPDGSKTRIYEGHIDPGNNVWNRGTFSYQFGNTEDLSPEEADRRQIAKIKRIHESVLLPKAKQYGVAPLTLAEELNGIDLINQAPLAVTETGGYIERLAEAKHKGLQGKEAILEARIWAFWDDAKGGWDAPGLRAYDDLGKEASIRHDQKRRMGMIEAALTTYQQQNDAIAQALPSKATNQQVPDISTSLHETTQVAQKTETIKAETMADLIISQTLLSSVATPIAIAP